MQSNLGFPQETDPDASGLLISEQATVWCYNHMTYMTLRAFAQLWNFAARKSL